MWVWVEVVAEHNALQKNDMQREYHVEIILEVSSYF